MLTNNDNGVTAQMIERLMKRNSGSFDSAAVAACGLPAADCSHPSDAKYALQKEVWHEQMLAEE